jgi:hypothetical protein
MLMACHGIQSELFCRDFEVPKDDEKYLSSLKAKYLSSSLPNQVDESLHLVVGLRLRRLNKTYARYFTLGTCDRIHCLAQTESKYFRNRRTSPASQMGADVHNLGREVNMRHHTSAQHPTFDSQMTRFHFSYEDTNSIGCADVPTYAFRTAPEFAQQLPILSITTCASFHPSALRIQSARLSKQ